MIKIVDKTLKPDFNKLVLHPLQSWEWGDFRLKTGIEAIRLGRFEKSKMVETALITVHPIPFTSYQIGYIPKGDIPTEEMLSYLCRLGLEKKCVFIKIEPNALKNSKYLPGRQAGQSQILKPGLRPSPHPLFTKYTFQLDLTKSEDELLKNMNQKTRYNIRLAEKKGVRIIQDNSDNAFGKYLQLMEETTHRQKFYAHKPSYHKLMWETLGPLRIARLFLAKYKNGDQEEILVAWVLFLFNNVLYYPYGASSTKFRNYMPSNLMMWEAIKYGKKAGAKKFDMWGALGPKADISDSWYGFHKFKEGYGAELVELAGSYDLVINPLIYRIYNLTHSIRELYLKIRR